MSEGEKREILVSQLLSEGRYLDKDKHDMELLSVLKSSTETPDTYKPAVYFSTVKRFVEAYERGESISFIEAISESALKLTVGIGGRARRDAINGELAIRGQSVSMSREVPKPTFYDKLFRREMVKQYEKQEAENMDLE